MYKNRKITALIAVIIAVLSVCPEIYGMDSLGTEKHMKYTLYIGLNDGDTGEQQIPTARAKEILNETANKYVDGYTLYEADGYWREDDKNFSEHTLVCVIVDASEQSVKNIMNEMLKALNQHSILLEVEETQSTFYSGK